MSGSFTEQESKSSRLHRITKSSSGESRAGAKGNTRIYRTLITSIMPSVWSYTERANTSNADGAITKMNQSPSYAKNFKAEYQGGVNRWQQVMFQIHH